MKIYKITNLINNKIYIGQTNGNNIYYKGSGKLLKLAFKKYGRKNFKIDIIADKIFNKKLLDELEIHYIQLYASRISKIGYNLALGPTQKGRSANQKFKEYISKVNLGNKNASGKRTLETKLKMSNAKLGTKQTITHIENIKLAKIKNRENKPYKYIPKLHKRKSIICLNINTNQKVIFESLMDASKILNVGKTSIGNNLKGLSLIVNKQYKFTYNA